MNVRKKSKKRRFIIRYLSKSELALGNIIFVRRSLIESNGVIQVSFIEMSQHLEQLEKFCKY